TIRPRPSDGFGSAFKTKAACVALCLIDVRRDVSIAPLGLNHAYAPGADEEPVIGRAAFGGPFCDRHVAPSGGPSPVAIAHCGCIDLPAARTELHIDERTGGSLIDIDLGGCRLSLRNDPGRRL